MMIHLASVGFDNQGSVYGVINLGSKLDELKKRISKVETLDGGTSIVDFGFAESDRVMDFNISFASQTDITKLERLVKLYPQLIISCYKGLFLGHPESLNSNENIYTLRFYVKERLGLPWTPPPPPIPVSVSEGVTDLPVDSTTYGFVVLESPVTGTIAGSGAGDTGDWFRIYLEQDVTVYITVSGSGSSGGTLANPSIAGIYDTSETWISGTFYDSYLESTTDAILTFTPTTTGYYYIEPASHDGVAGTYTLLVSLTPFGA